MTGFHLLFIAMLAFGSGLDENGLVDSLEHGLTESGFENVSVVREDKHLFVSYENRVYRHEIRAIREVMSVVLPAVETDMNVTLIPQNRGIPLVAIAMPVDRYLPLIDGSVSGKEFASALSVSLDVDSIWEKTHDIHRLNSSLYKLDVVVHPQFKAWFGSFSDPIGVESQINLAPAANTSLWKGMSLSAQLIIPLQNELGREGDSWSPGLLTANQVIRLPHSTFVSVTMGYFTHHRYGADLEITKHSANGRWSIGANAGYTGYASYVENILYYSRIDLVTGSFSAAYRFPQFDLNLGATVGKLIHGDKGIRLGIPL